MKLSSHRKKKTGNKHIFLSFFLVYEFSFVDLWVITVFYMYVSGALGKSTVVEASPIERELDKGIEYCRA
jgi:hypothetical protein